MQNIKIDKIVSDYIFNKDAQIDPVNMTKRVIKHCKSLENDITVDTLFDLLCTIDTLYKSIGLMRIINLDAMYVECDVELEKYIHKNNSKIYQKYSFSMINDQTKIFLKAYYNCNYTSPLPTPADNF